ncbi:MAG: serine hydrolase domain-containing protein, partial [Candidatus Thorarchaeota archaeon]
SEQDMNSTKLQDMLDYIDSTNYPIISAAVVRHGYMVLEHYRSEYRNENSTQYMYSVTKSFTSALIGIALAQGYFDNLSQPVLPFFPDKVIEIPDERRERVTIENLLTMRSGIFWDETSAPFTSPDNGIYHLMSQDGVEYVLNLPMVAEPDELWHYNTGASHLLSGIIQATTEMTAKEFGDETLFGPLGFSEQTWATDASGVVRGGFDLKITLRDMTKFGLLYLNNGTWDGEQIVPADWVTASTNTITDLGYNSGYGYQWWTLPDDGIFYAAGLYGQYIYVIPEYDMVVTFTSMVQNGPYLHQILLTNYIIQAAQDGADDDSTPGVINNELLTNGLYLSAAIALPIAAVSVLWYYRKRSSLQS